MSEERSRDEVLADNFLTFASPDEQNLFDPEVVESLIREYLDMVVANNVKVMKGELSTSEAVQQMTAACDRLSRIFMGTEPGFARAPWHSPAQLGAVIMARHPVEQVPTKAAGHFFMLVGLSVLNAMNLYMDEKLTKEDAQGIIEAEVDAAKRTLLGWPAGDGEDE